MLILILLTACSLKEEYFELGIDDYVIRVGYDDSEYMDIAFDFDMKHEFQAQETVDNVEIKLSNNLLGVGEFTNYSSKTKPSNKAILTSLTIYLDDLGDREFKLNGEPIESSIKANCNKFNGTYVEKNGYACVIENKIRDKLNVIELYGDYLNIDQDRLDRIEIYIK